MAEYVEQFVAEFGWTVEETMQHTYRQLELIIKAMAKRIKTRGEK